MATFAIDDTVAITLETSTGNLCAGVHIDEKSAGYLVRVGALSQNSFTDDELVSFSS